MNTSRDTICRAIVLIALCAITGCASSQTDQTTYKKANRPTETEPPSP